MKNLLTAIIILLALTQCVEEPTAPLTALGGKVTDTNGAAIEGATVTLQKKISITDKKGTYFFDDITTGTSTIKIEKDNYATISKTLTITSSAVKSENVSIIRFGKIIGKVTDKDGSAISGVRITTTPATSEALTDTSGSYELLDLEAGSYTIKAEKSGFANKTKSVTVTDGTVTNGDLTIFKEGEAPQGMVFIQGGTFQMGSNDYSFEQPIHSVTLNSFYIVPGRKLIFPYE